jgi:hypothetical protein
VARWFPRPVTRSDEWFTRQPSIISELSLGAIKMPRFSPLQAARAMNYDAVLPPASA